MFMLSEFHVIRTIRNTKCIAGVIFYFHVNQNFVLSEFVLSGFHCMSWEFYLHRNIILLSPSVLLREEMAGELDKMRRKVPQLESDRDRFVTQYDTEAEYFLEKTRKKVCFHIVL